MLGVCFLNPTNWKLIWAIEISFGFILLPPYLTSFLAGQRHEGALEEDGLFWKPKLIGKTRAIQRDSILQVLWVWLSKYSPGTGHYHLSDLVQNTCETKKHDSIHDRRVSNSSTAHVFWPLWPSYNSTSWINWGPIEQDSPTKLMRRWGKWGPLLMLFVVNSSDQKARRHELCPWKQKREYVGTSAKLERTDVRYSKVTSFYIHCLLCTYAFTWIYNVHVVQIYL